MPFNTFLSQLPTVSLGTQRSQWVLAGVCGEECLKEVVDKREEDQEEFGPPQKRRNVNQRGGINTTLLPLIVSSSLSSPILQFPFPPASFYKRVWLNFLLAPNCKMSLPMPER